MDTYKIIRFYRSAGILRRVIARGLSFEQAEKHCSSPETSSVTCTTATGKRRTRQLGEWFDGFTKE